MSHQVTLIKLRHGRDLAADLGYNIKWFPQRFGDGAMLVVPSVQESDAGLYRCTGTNPYGRTSYEDFNLEVIPGTEY